MTVLLIHSHYGPPPEGYATAAVDGRLAIVRERDLTAADFAAASGLITTTHLDQVGFLTHAQAYTALLDRGGRWFFNGHMLRYFIDGLGLYRPLVAPKRAGYALTRLYDHPIFTGIDQRGLEENKGVAGFYGRGHNPLPAGGIAVNGIGPEMHAIDWVWARPDGGQVFSHAGNDLGGMGGETGNGALLTQRIIAWCAGELGA
ncbi:hypothetical protein [Devosia lacusdianchii]|uniref:hypothetical protein n=1 Tax=Devosia lacusdianchii TaxID=2917991 RepID=UPI001F05854D|nr:hypothetical protein [Devosia sp. JXJ CY 41]